MKMRIYALVFNVKLVACSYFTYNIVRECQFLRSQQILQFCVVPLKWRWGRPTRLKLKSALCITAMVNHNILIFTMVY